DAFEKSKLNWEKRQAGEGKALLELHQHLIHLRRTMPVLKNLDKQNLEASAIEEDKLIFLRRRDTLGSQIFCI
ncbi:MAG TPA: malto-oligosyltrehalose trehalohydrolase, partial [Cyanobacteria bacterium UBA11371]|nr:malto-oligosyltrehalose trehalohydrolase [Cyanobacteria bacterium UBA11371]